MSSDLIQGFQKSAFGLQKLFDKKCLESLTSSAEHWTPSGSPMQAPDQSTLASGKCNGTMRLQTRFTQIKRISFQSVATSES